VLEMLFNYLGFIGRFADNKSRGFVGFLGDNKSRGFVGFLGDNKSRGFVGFLGDNKSRGFVGSLGDNKSKGFIGPIGDDLPSLIPIVISLVLFFSIFGMTLNTYSSKNFYLSKQIEMTSVAREIKGDSLIFGIDQFQTKCAQIKAKTFPYNFMVGLYDADTSLSDIGTDFLAIQESDSSVILRAISSSSGNLDPYFCKYVHVGAGKFDPSKKNSSYLVRYYPVAVQQPVLRALPGGDTVTEYLIIPGILAMVVWE
jgi:hypothetical protein